MTIVDIPCEKCEGNAGWVTVGSVDGDWKTGRCDCEYTRQILDHAKNKNIHHDPVISTEHATICAEMMATIPYFPGEPGARIAIADEIASMAADESQAVWLSRRMIRLYSRWPGLAEMRRVFWRNHKSLDGVEPIETYSEFYPSGIPLENPNLVCIGPGLTQPKREPNRMISRANESYEPFEFDLNALRAANAAKSAQVHTPPPTQVDIEEIKSQQERNRKLRNDPRSTS